jgi:hypothetical protein
MRAAQISAQLYFVAAGGMAVSNLYPRESGIVVGATTTIDFVLREETHS